MYRFPVPTVSTFAVDAQRFWVFAERTARIARQRSRDKGVRSTVHEGSGIFNSSVEPTVGLAAKREAIISENKKRADACSPTRRATRVSE